MQSSSGCGLVIPDTLHFQALEDWENIPDLRKFFPGPAGCLHGKKLECFWDLENAPLCDSWPVCRRPGLDLTPSQHFDLLYNVLANWHGVKYKDFVLHVYLSDSSAETLPRDVVMDINRLYGKNLNVPRPPGKTSRLPDGRIVRNKEEPFGVDARMKLHMEAYAERAEPGDVMMVITGDLDFDEGIRKAKQQHGLQILHLSSKDKHNRKWSGMLRSGIISWHCWLDDFLMFHKDNPAIRLSPANQSKQLIEKAKKRREVQDDLGPLGIVILIDATNSMEKAIDMVKEQIDKLLSHLLSRDLDFAGRVQYAVVGYRDIGDERQFEIMGHVEGRPKEQQTHFTCDTNAVRDFLGGLQAYGGRDFPEDIAGAVLKVSQLNFDKQRLNMVFHILNDPGHGHEFNDTYSEDEYLDHPPPPPREDPALEIARAFKILKQECNVVKYHMLTINNPCRERPSTAKTVEKMKEISSGIELKSSVNLEQSSFSGMHQSWIEERPVEPDCAQIMRVISMCTSMRTSSEHTLRQADKWGVSQSNTQLSLLARRRSLHTWAPKLGRATTRAVSNATAMTIASGRVNEWEESEKPRKGTVFKGQEDPELLLGVACTVEMDDLKVASRISQGLGSTSTGVSSRMKAKPLAFQHWYHGPGLPALMRLDSKIKDRGLPFQTVLYEMLEEPRNLDDLLELVDSRGKLDVLFEVQKTRKYKILDEVMAVGQERVCKLAMDRAPGGQLQVLKHFRHDGTSAQSHFRYQSLLASHTLASFLAKMFSTVLDEHCIEGNRIEYVDACIVSFQLPNGKVSYRFHEQFMAGHFMKYTSNTGWIDENALPVCLAFPHWVYCATQGRLMVSDIQGWHDAQSKRVILTDPCLLCSSIGLMEDKDKDQGLQGMKDFFISHECDSICQRLGLHLQKPSKEAIREIQEQIDATASSGAGGKEGSSNPRDLNSISPGGAAASSSASA
ncbi:hypothetical protein DUNSADRAFT_1113 [Dunaliella salina]|uniref:Alpha-type protein kinase domain-containing protein n=1 Tax=Dunaliella salina TaxID=3046 RepID=A0ABQ7FY03_DUNSA|nr:hypothetical protein DUNSADRAFT_1113 [Dunaliella salina]KAF5827234.1 hypothetical protein DUNSADRAFT_1113 [Dunaliella salina]|eukprot:KAF5827231.1 hypothetical protein DUNSADRAFT_1113 [Dunaliella salina]